MSDIWPPYFFPHELPAPTVGAQRKLEVRVLAKRLIGNTDLQSQEKEREEKKMGEIKKRESRGKKERRRVCREEKKRKKNKPSRALKSKNESQRHSIWQDALKQWKKGKRQSQIRGLLPGKKRKREMGWWAADVTKEIVLETSHQQIHKTMVPSWAKHTISGIMQCDTLSFSLSLYLKRRCFASLSHLRFISKPFKLQVSAILRNGVY